MAPLDRLHTSSYSSSVVTMAVGLPFAVCEIGYRPKMSIR